MKEKRKYNSDICNELLHTKSTWLLVLQEDPTRSSHWSYSNQHYLCSPRHWSHYRMHLNHKQTKLNKWQQKLLDWPFQYFYPIYFFLLYSLIIISLCKLHTVRLSLRIILYRIVDVYQVYVLFMEHPGAEYEWAGHIHRILGHFVTQGPTTISICSQHSWSPCNTGTYNNKTTLTASLVTM